MEELLESFSSTCLSENSGINAAHPRFSQYKLKTSKSSQAERRAKFLDAQKSKRYDYVNHARQLATQEWDNDVQEGDMTVDDEEEDDEDMECDLRPVKSKRVHKDQLMLSEWMVEVPEDLDTNWLLVLCPIGKRCLVIASKGVTKCYSRSGYCMKSFPSSLPGGNRKNNWGSKPVGYTILDCFYCELEKTFYVLDVMAWSGYPFYDSDTECRFYLLHSKFEELPEVTKAASANPNKFLPLPFFNCDEATVKNVLWSPLPFSTKLDGLLFFHKKAHYVPKQMPLVIWLKAYMVPEVLKIPVPDSLCADRPPTYTTMKEHVPKAFEQHQKRKDKKDQQLDIDES